MDLKCAGRLIRLPACKTLLLVMGCACVSATARADLTPVDIVTLKDGTRMEGRITSRELGKFVVINVPGGVPKVLAWDTIREIETLGSLAPDGPRSSSAP